MMSSPVDHPIQHFVYPLQLAFLCYVTIRGVLHLRYGPTRVVAKKTLILLALADFCLLLTMLPQSLATFSFFYENESCRRFVHYSKVAINAWSNVFSATEVFLTVAICVECYLRARASSMTKWFSNGFRFWSLMAFAFCVSLLLSGYHFVLYEIKTGFRCNGEKMVSKLVLNSSFTPSMVRFFNIGQAVFVIALPCIVVALCNRRLAAILREGKLPLVNNECQELVSSESWPSERPRCVRRLSLITVAFVLSHVLSFVPFLYDIFPGLYLSELFPAFITIMNSVLVTGKLVTLLLLFDSCRDLARTGFY